MIGKPRRTKQMFDDFYLYLCGWLKRGHAAPISLASWWFQFCFNWLDLHWFSMKKVNISTFVYCFLYLFVAPGFLNGGIFFTLKKTICPFFPGDRSAFGKLQWDVLQTNGFGLFPLHVGGHGQFPIKNSWGLRDSTWEFRQPKVMSFHIGHCSCLIQFT